MPHTPASVLLLRNCPLTSVGPVCRPSQQISVLIDTTSVPEMHSLGSPGYLGFPAMHLDVAPEALEIPAGPLCFQRG